MIDAGLLRNATQMSQNTNNLKGMKGQKLNVKTEQDIMMLKNGGNSRYVRNEKQSMDQTQNQGRFTELENKFLQLMQDADGNFHLQGSNDEILQSWKAG